MTSSGFHSIYYSPASARNFLRTVSSPSSSLSAINPRAMLAIQPSAVKTSPRSHGFAWPGRGGERRWLRGAESLADYRIHLGPRMTGPRRTRIHGARGYAGASRFGSELQERG